MVCSGNDVASLLYELDITKSSRPDNISPRILKEYAHELASYLAGIFNLSLSTGELPDDWKMSNVVPIYKAGERVMAVNFSHEYCCQNLRAHESQTYYESSLRIAPIM